MVIRTSGILKKDDKKANRMIDVTKILEDALDKISDEYDEEKNLKFVLHIALAAYNIGEIASFCDYSQDYMEDLKQKIEKIISERGKMH